MKPQVMKNLPDFYFTTKTPKSAQVIETSGSTFEFLPP